MAEAALQNEPLIKFSIKLCAAIKKHECIFTQKTDLFKNASPECEAAWNAVAEESEETVENCKWRWKSMRKGFFRAVRKGSKYYLHEYLEFLLPSFNEHEPDDGKTNDEIQEDISTTNTTSQDDEETNDETITDEPLPKPDTTSVKLERNKDEKIKKGKKEGEGFDSDTTSADESHIIPAKDKNPETDTNQVGEFVISEINESVSKNKGNEGRANVSEVQNQSEVGVHANEDGISITDVSVNNDEDMDSAENRSRRSRYGRACKRGLDAEILNELTAEKQEEKRPRRSMERRKTLASIALEEFSKRKSLARSAAKKNETKTQKPKTYKNNNSKTNASDTSMEMTANTDLAQNMETPVFENTEENVYTPANIDAAINLTPVNMFPPIDLTDNRRNIATPAQYIQLTHNTAVNNLEAFQNDFHKESLNQPKPQMIDSSTITTIETRDSSSQYDLQQVAVDFDDSFINSLKPQLQLMNARQKMNFKRKVFQSIMEVFDDASNFPNTNECIILPPGGAPRFDTTTNAELHLMRELVSLVQAAKTAPELISTTDKTKTTTPVLEKPPTPQILKVRTPMQAPSPTLSSPSLDDDEDFSFVTEPVNDDDTPRSAGEILARRDDDDVLGLPRRVIHKVVKVAGPNGSTIVAGEGNNRRVYRIYPKNPNSNTACKISGNVGNMYVTPSKSGVAQIHQQRSSKYANISFNPIQHRVTNTVNTSTPINTNNKTQTITTPSNNNNSLNTSTSTNTTQRIPPSTSLNTSTNTIQRIPSSTSLNTSTNTTQKTQPNTSLNTSTSTNTAQKIPPNTAGFGISYNNSTSSSSNNRTQPNTSFANKPETTRLILDPNTGHFMHPNAVTSKTSPATNKPTNSPMMAPNSNNQQSNTSSNPQQRVMVRTTTQTINGTAGNIMQRRYSICGPAPARSPLPVAGKPLTKSFIQNPKVSSNCNTIKTSVSQIQISKPVSLNANVLNAVKPNQISKPITSNSNAPNTNNSVKTVTSNTPSPPVCSVTFNTRSFTQSTPQPTPSNQVARNADSPQQSQQIPVLETAGTITADSFSDPLFVKPLIKDEPLE